MKFFYLACISASFIGACLTVPSSERASAENPGIQVIDSAEIQLRPLENPGIQVIDSDLQLKGLDIIVLNDTDLQLRQLAEHYGNVKEGSWNNRTIIVDGGSSVYLPATYTFDALNDDWNRKIIRFKTTSGYELVIACGGFAQFGFGEFVLRITANQNKTKFNENDEIRLETHSRVAKMLLKYRPSFFVPIECMISSKKRDQTTTPSSTAATTVPTTANSTAASTVPTTANSTAATTVPTTANSTAATTVPTTANSTAATTVSTSAPKGCRCGKRQRSGKRIVGGEITDRREFPWQVGVVRKYGNNGYAGPICGGTIVSARHVITAAHCTIKATAGQQSFSFAIHYGSDKRQLTLETIAEVEEVFDHQDYNNKSPPNNDISVLRLARPLNFTADLSPACLPDDATKDFVGKDSIVTGWGHTSFNGTASDDMRKVTLPIISNNACQRAWNNQYAQPDTKLCTAVNPGKDSCQGDSGGPLVVDDSGNYELAGVVSFGYKCADVAPGVYTRVTSYLPWIKNIISGDSLCGR